MPIIISDLWPGGGIRFRAHDGSSRRALRRIGDSQSTLLLQPVLNLLEPPFTGPQRRGAGVDRVGSEHKVVGMRSRRPKHERGVGLRMDAFNRVIRRLEDRKFASVHMPIDRRCRNRTAREVDEPFPDVDARAVGRPLSHPPVIFTSRSLMSS